MDIKSVSIKGHRVLLEPVEPEEISKGGIVVVTETTLKREAAATDTGRVIAVGPTAWHSFDRFTPDGKRNPSWEPWCKPGDLILFAKFGGKFITAGDKTYVVINDEDVQCVLEEGNE